MDKILLLGMLVLLYHLNTHYTSHGGRSGHGSNCGSFSVNTNDVVSGTLWGLGAALYIHIILVMVVLLTLVYIVGLSLFMRTLVSLLQPGPLVLLYHCAHYTSRGAFSSDGTRCGVFSVVGSYAFSIAYWIYGTVLE